MSFQQLLKERDQIKKEENLIEVHHNKIDELNQELQKIAIQEGNLGYLWQVRAAILCGLDEGHPHSAEDCIALKCPPIIKMSNERRAYFENRCEELDIAINKLMENGEVPPIFNRIQSTIEEWKNLE